MDGTLTFGIIKNQGAMKASLFSRMSPTNKLGASSSQQSGAVGQPNQATSPTGRGSAVNRSTIGMKSPFREAM